MRIAIVGGSPSSEHLAPFDDPSWEIWVHGNQMDRHQNHRVTRIFEIHDDLSEQDPRYPKWLVDQPWHNGEKIPLVVGPRFPVDGEHVELYPVDRVTEIIGQHLTSTPAYMMGYALYHYEPEEIGLYGIDMAVDDHEYFKQRPSMYAWIGYAIARGIRVTIPPESSLFREPYVEGTDWGGRDGGNPPFTAGEFGAMEKMHRDKVESLQSEIQSLENRVHTHNGAALAYNRLAKIARAVDGGAEIKTLTESARVR